MTLLVFFESGQIQPLTGVTSITKSRYSDFEIDGVAFKGVVKVEVLLVDDY